MWLWSMFYFSQVRTGRIHGDYFWSPRNRGNSEQFVFEESLAALHLSATRVTWVLHWFWTLFDIIITMIGLYWTSFYLEMYIINFLLLNIHTRYFWFSWKEIYVGQITFSKTFNDSTIKLTPLPRKGV